MTDPSILHPTTPHSPPPKSTQTTPFTHLNTTYGTITGILPDSLFPSSLRITPSTSIPTDIWRKPGPPIINTFNAPVLYKAIPMSQFESVRVCVSAHWKEQYDQGGLVIILPPAAGDGDKGVEEYRWVKAGIEFYEGEAVVSVVACDRWADWSLSGKEGVCSEWKVGMGPNVSLEMERKGGGALGLCSWGWGGEGAG